MNPRSSIPLLAPLPLWLTASLPGAVQVVDPVDGLTVTTTHLATTNTWQLDPTEAYFERTSPTVGRIGLNVTPPFRAFTDGGTLLLNSSTLRARYATTASGSGLGGQVGLNYARLDTNADAIFETVVEFDFGPSLTDRSDDVITRYAFNDDGSELDIPEAVAAFTIPEVSATSLVLLSLSLLVVGRRRHLQPNAA